MKNMQESRKRVKVTPELPSIRRRKSWGLGEKEADLVIELMKADGWTDEEMYNDMLAFLYAKGVMKEKSVEERMIAYKNLLYPEKANVSDESKKKLEDARERLERIVKKGEYARDVKVNSDYFTEFVKEHPEWGPDSSFVIFRDHSKLKGKPYAYVERVQLSGLCYMHAPVVLQHYLVAMNSTEHVPMLDMGKYLKKYVTGKALERRIWDNEGGDSQNFLKNILISKPHTLFLDRSGTDDLKEYLMTLGPALISRFEVEDVFMDVTNWRHCGSMTGQSNGLHSMLLVGFRKEGNETRYLVQNWWKQSHLLKSVENILNPVLEAFAL